MTRAGTYTTTATPPPAYALAPGVGEAKGGAGVQDYGFRLYSPAMGRFLSVDPLTSDYPWYSPYQFAGNKPIWAVDADGAQEDVATYMSFQGGEPVLSSVRFDPDATPLAGNYIHTITQFVKGNTIRVEYGSTNDMSIAAVRAKAERNARHAELAANGVNLLQAVGNAAGFWFSAVNDRLEGGGVTDMREYTGTGSAVLEQSFVEIADAEIDMAIWSSQAALAYFTAGASFSGALGLSTLGRTALINGGTDFASQLYFENGNLGDVNLFGVASSAAFANPFTGGALGNAVSFTGNRGLQFNLLDRSSALSGLVGGVTGRATARLNFDSILRPGAPQTGLDLTVSGTFTSQAQLATGRATSEE